jgi:hypothetical protein
MVDIADLSDGRQTNGGNPPGFARGQPYQRIIAFDSHGLGS